MRLSSLFFAVLLTIPLCAAELSWAESFAHAQERALSEKKNILVLVTSERCRWCKKLKNTTLKDTQTVARLEAGFVPLEVTRGVDEYPEYLKAKMVPMSYFLYPDGTMIMRGVAGYWTIEDYNSFLDDVDYKLKKNRERQK